MKRLIVFAGLLLAGPSWAQEPLTVAEQQPEYPGGTADMMRYLQQEVKVTGMTCGEETHLGCQKVFIKFTVDTTGKVIDPHVTSLGVECPGFNEEILRVIKAMPAWKPGMQDGKKVKVYYSIPAYIRLQ